MIGFVNGEIEDIFEDRVLIDCGFMGYNIFVPTNVIERCRIGEEVKLYTYLSVREDAMTLFGFFSKDELKIFKLLISVNGIGPKCGLAVLSMLSPNDLRFAVLSEDVKLISKVPGIGAKTAQKVILELKDKLNIEDTFMTESNSLTNISSVSYDNNIMKEAIEALTALGYSQSEAAKAVNSCDSSMCDSVESIIKLALKNM